MYNFDNTFRVLFKKKKLKKSHRSDLTYWQNLLVYTVKFILPPLKITIVIIPVTNTIKKEYC